MGLRLGLSTGTEVLDHPLEPRVSDDAGNAASFGHRPALHLLHVGGEGDGAGAADVATHAEAIYRRPFGQELADALGPELRHSRRARVRRGRRLRCWRVVCQEAVAGLEPASLATLAPRSRMRVS